MRKRKLSRKFKFSFRKIRRRVAKRNTKFWWKLGFKRAMYGYRNKGYSVSPWQKGGKYALWLRRFAGWWSPTSGKGIYDRWEK